MSKHVDDIDRGWKDIMRGVVSSRPRAVRVGVQGDEAKEMNEEGATMALLAAVHEYGTRDGRVPERAPIRTALNQHEGKYNALIARLARLVYIDRTMTEDHALGLLGAQVSSDIMAGMEAGLSPDIAESTKADKKRRGKDGPHKPLIESGQFKDAYNYAVEP